MPVPAFQEAGKKSPLLLGERLPSQNAEKVALLLRRSTVLGTKPILVSTILGAKPIGSSGPIRGCVPIRFSLPAQTAPLDARQTTRAHFFQSFVLINVSFSQVQKNKTRETERTSGQAMRQPSGTS